MKAMIVALSVILVITLLVVGNALYLPKRLECVSGLIESAEDTEALDAVIREYKSIELMLSLCIQGDVLREVEIDLRECRETMLSDDENAIRIAKSRLVERIAQLRRLSGFDLRVIL